MQERKSQQAYATARIDEGLSSLDERIYTAMYRYLSIDLGLPKAVAEDRARLEISGKIGRTVCGECEHAGLSFRGRRVLDLGAGLGGVSAEMAVRGATVIAIEPGAGWRQVAGERLARAGVGVVIGAVGEELPVASESIDLIVSQQVLEHVQDPARVIREAFRILKPGGHFYFSYENYLSFWEPHYRVRWLPLLPKPLGAAYLRSLGRDPQFLLEAVTYTTYHSVRRTLFREGFECMRMEGYKESLSSPQKTGAKWRVLKSVASVNRNLAVGLLAANDFRRHVLKTSISEFMRKPEKPVK